MSDEPRIAEYVARHACTCCACGRKIEVGDAALTIMHRSIVETTHAICPTVQGGGAPADRLMRDLLKELR